MTHCASGVNEVGRKDCPRTSGYRTGRTVRKAVAQKKLPVKVYSLIDAVLTRTLESPTPAVWLPIAAKKRFRGLGPVSQRTVSALVPKLVGAGVLREETRDGKTFIALEPDPAKWRSIPKGGRAERQLPLRFAKVGPEEASLRKRIAKLEAENADLEDENAKLKLKVKVKVLEVEIADLKAKLAAVGEVAKPDAPTCENDSPKTRVASHNPMGDMDRPPSLVGNVVVGNSGDGNKKAAAACHQDACTRAPAMMPPPVPAPVPPVPRPAPPAGEADSAAAAIFKKGFFLSSAVARRLASTLTTTLGDLAYLSSEVADSIVADLKSREAEGKIKKPRSVLPGICEDEEVRAIAFEIEAKNAEAREKAEREKREDEAAAAEDAGYRSAVTWQPQHGWRPPTLEEENDRRRLLSAQSEAPTVNPWAPTRPAPKPPMTQEEIDARKALLKAQADAL